ncbi:MAG: GNAT family N-acetyltransferase [Stenotrophobium sp.]
MADARAIHTLENHFPSDRMSLRSVRRFLQSESAALWVAQTSPASRLPSPAIAGCLILLTRANSRAARIYSVVVDPAVRGRGIAARLVQTAEAGARKQGLSVITLEVRTDNAPARALYRKHGYTEDQRLSGFYDDGTDGLRLRKIL